jgi:hypothetical protein
MDNLAIKKLLSGIRERVNEESATFIADGTWNCDSGDDLIWDIEALIEAYREEVMSRKENTVAQNLA